MTGMRRVTRNDRPDWPQDDPANCAAFNAAALALLLRTDSVRVVLIATSRRVIETEAYAPEAGAPIAPRGALEGLSALVATLRAAGKQVVFLHDNPAIGESSDCVPRLTGIAMLDHRLPLLRGRSCNLPYPVYVESIARYRGLIAALKAANPDLAVEDPTPLLCDRAASVCPMVHDGRLLYSYGDHLSTYGGDLVASELLQTLQGLSPKA